MDTTDGRNDTVKPFPSKGRQSAPTEAILDGVRYTAADFLEGTKPFEVVYACREDAFTESRMIERMAGVAKTLQVNGFKRLYSDYKASLRKKSETTSVNYSNFDAQNAELNVGEWIAEDNMIWRYGANGAPDIACTHPIMPVERLRNIDTGELKVRIQFRRGEKNRRAWEERIVDFDVLSNARNIVQLSKIGISVTSGKRAQNLVDFLTDVMDLNYDAIPERHMVSRLGWNEYGFSPYGDDLVLDNSSGFAEIFAAVKPKGDYEEWLNVAREVRKMSVTARIVLAASFASVLIKPLGALSFFVHLWSSESATGKSVGQMVGASVWGDPTIGGAFFPTFKATSVGLEFTAGFLNSVPLFLDELQLAKDARGKVIFNVYELASGAGKQRGNRDLGLSVTPTWANCFITSGETPIVGENDGAGAHNRVLEIECGADNVVLTDGMRISSSVRKNYGHAGKAFVELLRQDGMIEQAKKVYECFYNECLTKDATEKQALAGAMLLTADFYATSYIFQDDRGLDMADLETFMKTKEQVSVGARAYEYLCGWVSQNANKFVSSKNKEPAQEVYGAITQDWSLAYINRKVFDGACSDAGFSPKAVLGHFKARELIELRGKGYTKNRNINGVPTDCVVLKLPKYDYSEAIDVL